MAREGIELPEPTRNSDGDVVIVGDGVDIGDAPEISANTRPTKPAGTP